jgi:hypothetical protein
LAAALLETMGLTAPFELMLARMLVENPDRIAAIRLLRDCR